MISGITRNSSQAFAIGLLFALLPNIALSEDLATGQFDGFYTGEIQQNFSCDSGYRGTRYFMEAKITGGVFAELKGPQRNNALGKVLADGAIEARVFLRMHRSGEEKYNHYEGTVSGNHINIRVFGALADKASAVCYYPALVLTKVAPPTKGELAKARGEIELSKISRSREHFTNALARYQAARDCMARDVKDAESITRTLLGVSRASRDTRPEHAKRYMRAALDNYLEIADVAKSMKCADVADTQFRAIKRLLRKVDMPGYQQRLDAAMGGG